MTLASVSRYDKDRASTVERRAVVVGGSLAGLLAARVLGDFFEEVVVLERDPTPDGTTARRGVPQGRHVHALQEAGRATIEDLFPGYGEELLSAGGLLVDIQSDFVHYEKGGFLADGPTRLPAYFASRPLLERIVRRRVAGADGIDLRDGCQWTDYLTTDSKDVGGVEFRDEAGTREELAADLVVDATGRTSRTPAWLEDHGYPAPDVSEVTVDLAYSSVAVERPPGDRRAFFVAFDAPRTRAAGVFPVEGDRWLVTLAGMHGDHPPKNLDGLRAFAASLPGPDIETLLDPGRTTSDDVAHYPFPSNRRYRYEDLDRFPAGLVVVGDAVASFNPIYGQGMSVAALDALQLHHALAAGGRQALARRYFDRLEAVVDVPWSIAVGGDFEFPQTTGPKPTGTDLLNRYVGRLTRRAQADGALREALVRVFMMERPPESLFRPRVLWRVLGPARSGAESSPDPVVWDGAKAEVAADGAW